MIEWQDIASAPKNGTKVLLGRFAPGKDMHGLIEVDWYRTNACKSGFLGFGRFNGTYWPATHWMPLPAPPQETDK